MHTLSDDVGGGLVGVEGLAGLAVAGENTSGVTVIELQLAVQVAGHAPWLLPQPSCHLLAAGGVEHQVVYVWREEGGGVVIPAPQCGRATHGHCHCSVVLVWLHIIRFSFSKNVNEERFSFSWPINGCKWIDFGEKILVQFPP